MHKSIIFISCLVMLFVFFSFNQVSAISVRGLHDYYVFNETGPSPTELRNFCVSTGSLDCNSPQPEITNEIHNVPNGGFQQTGAGIFPNNAINFSSGGQTAGASTYGACCTFNTDSYDWLSNGNAFTVNFWYRYQGYTNGTHSGSGNDVLSTFAAGADTTGGLIINVGDNWCMELRNTNEHFPFSGCIQQHIPNDPSWHMITVELVKGGSGITSDKIDMYQDGLLVNEYFSNYPSDPFAYYTTGSKFLAVANDWYRINGCGPCSAQYFQKGLLTQMSIWSRTLSQHDITALWNNGAGIDLFAGKVRYSIQGIALNNIASVAECYQAIGSNPFFQSVSQQRLYLNGSLVQTYTFPQPWNYTDTNDVECPHFFMLNFTAPANFTVQTTWTPSNPVAVNGIGSLYLASGNQVPAGNSANITPNLTWFSYRSTDFKHLFIEIFKTPNPFSGDCLVTNGTFVQSSRDYTFANVTSANVTASVNPFDNAFYQCKGTDPFSFSGRSAGNSTALTAGITSINQSFGAMIGLPAGMFVVTLVASLANSRTGPIYVVITLAFAGILGLFGFFTLSVGFWAIQLLVGALGLIVGRKIF